MSSPRPFALTVGWLRPAVLVSSALVERLAPAELEVVVAHERSHAAWRDALAATAAGVLARGHLPAIRRRILAELALAAEQAVEPEERDLGLGRLDASLGRVAPEPAPAGEVEPLREQHHVLALGRAADADLLVGPGGLRPGPAASGEHVRAGELDASAELLLQGGSRQGPADRLLLVERRLRRRGAL